jgi:hypothetical protein
MAAAIALKLRLRILREGHRLVPSWEGPGYDFARQTWQWAFQAATAYSDGEIFEIEETIGHLVEEEDVFEIEASLDLTERKLIYLSVIECEGNPSLYAAPPFDEEHAPVIAVPRPLRVVQAPLPEVEVPVREIEAPKPEPISLDVLRSDTEQDVQRFRKSVETHFAECDSTPEPRTSSSDCCWGLVCPKCSWKADLGSVTVKRAINFGLIPQSFYVKVMALAKQTEFFTALAIQDHEVLYDFVMDGFTLFSVKRRSNFVPAQMGVVYQLKPDALTKYQQRYLSVTVPRPDLKFQVTGVHIARDSDPYHSTVTVEVLNVHEVGREEEPEDESEDEVCESGTSTSEGEVAADSTNCS